MAKSEKPTLHVYAGWKHTFGRGCSRQIVVSQGGGTHNLEISKTATLEDVTAEIVNLFFPNGRNICQNLQLENLVTSVTKYDGSALFEGNHGTFGEVAKNIRTRPIRVYLNTRAVADEPPQRRRRNNDAVDDEDYETDSELPEILCRRQDVEPEQATNPVEDTIVVGEGGLSTPTEPTVGPDTMSDDQDEQNDTSSANDVGAEQTGVDDIEVQVSASTVGSDAGSQSGTPTVTTNLLSKATISQT